MQKHPPLLPAPRRYLPRAGVFRLSANLPVILHPSAEDTDYDSAVALRERVARQAGVVLSIETHARRNGLGAYIELVRHDDTGTGESYRIETTRDAIRVVGSGRAGLRYGVETLGQLVRNRTVACSAIEDAPDLPSRGLLVDISRGKVPTLDTLKSIVDDMVRLKLNVLMLYTEHVFRFRRHPAIGRGASPMEAWELRELDAYAAKRHVELVPTLQSLGHMHHLLGIRRYRHLAESARRWSISPALEESYALLDDLYSEYLPNFRSPRVNVNCDEPVDLGKGLSKEWAERDGPAAVFAAHVTRVQALAARHDKQTMIWADVVYDHPEVLDLLPDGLVFIDWWYEAKHDFDRVHLLADKARPFIVAGGTTGWNALFPRGANAVANIRGYADAVKRHGGIGFIVTDWGDGGHPNLWGNASHAIAWGAQCAWGETNLEDTAFDRAFSWSLFSDRSGAVGRLYRRAGALHETGFDHFNHSPLKSLYFDDWSDPKFTGKSVRRTLARTLERLGKLEDDFRRCEEKLRSRPLTASELGFALGASRDAAEKGLVGLDYLAFGDAPARWTRARRKSLARKVSRLLERQLRAKEEHWRLWRARNRESSFETTRSYYDASIRGLRRALRKLTRN